MRFLLSTILLLSFTNGVWTLLSAVNSVRFLLSVSDSVTSLVSGPVSTRSSLLTTGYWPIRGVRSLSSVTDSPRFPLSMYYRLSLPEWGPLCQRLSLCIYNSYVNYFSVFVWYIWFEDGFISRVRSGLSKDTVKSHCRCWRGRSWYDWTIKRLSITKRTRSVSISTLGYHLPVTSSEISKSYKNYFIRYRIHSCQTQGSNGSHNFIVSNKRERGQVSMDPVKVKIWIIFISMKIKRTWSEKPVF